VFGEVRVFWVLPAQPTRRENYFEMQAERFMEPYLKPLASSARLVAMDIEELRQWVSRGDGSGFLGNASGL